MTRLRTIRAAIARTALLALTIVMAAGLAPAAQARVRINLGTIAPEGSPWHDALLELGQDWKRISEGEVQVRIYPSGRMGDEHEMITKIRNGIIQGAAISSVGLSHVDDGVSCLSIPLLFDSYAELDHVRERIAPLLEKRLEERGFVVLSWGDAGWIRFFTKKPATTPDELREMKLFVPAGNAETLEIYRAAGLTVRPLAVTDIQQALQTGMIDAFDVPPLLALHYQWFGQARNMVDLKWAPLIGATVVSREAWERIPESLRPRLKEAARGSAKAHRDTIRRLGKDSIAAMQELGLAVHPVDEKTLALWRAEAEAVYPKLRGGLIPAELFDEVKRLRDEFRAAPPATK